MVLPTPLVRPSWPSMAAEMMNDFGALARNVAVAVDYSIPYKPVKVCYHTHRERNKAHKGVY